MKEQLQQWMARRPRPMGLLGCGVVLADKSVVGQSFSTSLPISAIEKMCRGLGELVNSANDQYLPMIRLRWVFEQGLCHAVPRADGACLIWITSREFNGYRELNNWAVDFESL